MTRTEYDGTITVILDRFEGKRLNSPNDIVVKSDDSIWFTDPPFGILGHYEGHAAEAELPTNVYRVDGRTGEATVVCGDVDRPNGLCFSPDETPALRGRVGRLAAPHPRLRPERRRHAGSRNDRVFIRRGIEARPTASAATSTATSGPAGAPARAATA